MTCLCTVSVFQSLMDLNTLSTYIAPIVISVAKKESSFSSSISAYFLFLDKSLSCLLVEFFVLSFFFNLYYRRYCVNFASFVASRKPKLVTGFHAVLQRNQIYLLRFCRWEHHLRKLFVIIKYVETLSNKLVSAAFDASGREKICSVLDRQTD